MQAVHTAAQCLQTERELLGYYQHAMQLMAFTTHIHTLLPEALRPFCRVGSYQEDKLVIYADNNAIASRLRQMHLSLSTALQAQGITIAALKIKVSPHSQLKTAPVVKPMLSEKAIAQIQAGCSQIKEGEVKIALEKLLAHSLAKQKNR